MRKLSLFGGAMIATGCLAMSANAASLESFFNPIGEIDEANDDDRSILIDRFNQDGGNIGFEGLEPHPTTGGRTLDVGDSLEGIVRFTRLNSIIPNIGAPTPNDHADLHFRIMVTSKTVSQIDINGPLPGGLIDVFAFSFGPDTFTPLDPANPGAMGILYTDAPGDLTDIGDSGISVAASIASVTDGTRFWTFGFTGPAGTTFDTVDIDGNGSVTELIPTIDPVLGSEGGVAFNVITDDVDDLHASVTSGTGAALENLGLSKIDVLTDDGNDITLVPVPGLFGASDLNFVGTIGGMLNLPNSNWDLSSQATVTFNVDAFVPVPEPTTAALGMMGLGALAGLASRRRRNA